MSTYYIPLPPRREQVALGLNPTGCTDFIIRSDLEQLPFFDQQIDHGQNCRRLGVHGAANLGETQPDLLVLKQFHQLIQHVSSQSEQASALIYDEGGDPCDSRLIDGGGHRPRPSKFMLDRAERGNARHVQQDEHQQRDRA